MEMGIFILCVFLSLGILIVSAAYAHRILTETKIKARAFERSFFEEKSQETKIDEMSQRLDEFRNQRFGRQLVQPPDVRAAIAARIKAQDRQKNGA